MFPFTMGNAIVFLEFFVFLPPDWGSSSED